MTNCTSISTSIKRAGLALTFATAGLGATPAFATDKTLIQMQVQIQQLQDSVARLQQSNDERMGVLKDLVQQSSDSVNRMSVTVDTLQKQMRTQQEAAGGKLDQVSTQVQTLSDSVDEIKARLNRLDKTLADIQNTQQSINGTLQNMAPAPMPASVAPTGPGMAQDPGTLPPAQPTGNRKGKPSAGIPMAAATMPAPMLAATAAPAAPPVGDLYHTALNDYMAAKTPLATSEFSDVSRLYPDDPLAGNALFYLGEIDYHAGKFATAIKDYDQVLEQFPDNPKVAVSHLHKGMALFALKQNDAGVREMRALIARFPNAPEAAQARSKLNGMGVPVVAKQR